MQRLIIWSFCFICAGCETAAVVPVVPQEIMQKRFITLSQLHAGLTRPEVENLLGQEVFIGYNLVENISGQYKPVTIANPQRRETFTKNNKAYAVDYYLVGIKTADDKITDDELAPLVFVNDHLVGFGWDFLNKQLKGP